MRTSHKGMLGMTACGFALFFAWFSIAAFGLPLPADGAAGTAGGLLARGTFFVALFAASVFVKFTARRLERIALGVGPTALFGACCAAPALYLCLCADGQTSWPALCALEATGGAGCACMFASWGTVASRARPESFIRLEGLSCASGLLVACPVIACAPGRVGAACALAFLAASCTLLCVASAVLGPFTTPTGTRNLKHVSGHMDKRFRALFFVMNLSFGLSWFIGSPSTAQLAISLIAGSAAAALLVAVTRKQPDAPDRYIVNLMRIGLGVAIGAYALAAAGVPFTALAARSLLVALWVACWTVDNSLLQQQAAEFGLSVAEHGADSKVINNAGFAVGWLAGAVCLSTGGVAGNGMALWGGFAVLIAVLGAWLLPFNTYDSPDMIIAKQAETARKRARIDAAVDAKSAQIGKAVKRYELTTREHDTLIWLMRGKTAKGIADELDVSVPTVKTHMYNIYRKLGVHSQRELMELVEGL